MISTVILALVGATVIGILAFASIGSFTRLPFYARLVVAALAAFLAAIGYGALIQQHADAAYVTKTLYHYAPDDGYDPAIIYTCDWSQRYGHAVPLLAEGRRSSCNVKGVYVQTGEEIWCKTTPGGISGGWVRRFDATGWHQASYYDGYGCTMRKD